MMKTMIMLEMGWTSRQYCEENTMEDLSQLLLVIDKRATVQNYPKPPSPRSSPPVVRKGSSRHYR